MKRATLEERLVKATQKEQMYTDKAKQAQAQIRQLEQQKKAEDKKKRTKRLIQIGASVESVLGRDFEENDIPKLIAFLRKQEFNGKYFSKAMNGDD